ncbi:MAG: hypothetical protein IT165_37975 [Bryobacterales bacterium]|nr:hypothetical protein [Bryobacterales bacterium]
MAKTTLVEKDIEEGRKFIDLIRREGVGVESALWSKDFFGRWQLVLVTPVVDQVGVREAYLRLLQILKRKPEGERPGVGELDISLFTPKSYYAKSLRQDLKKARDLHVSRQPVGDHFIDEGFIYFVN